MSDPEGLGGLLALFSGLLVAGFVMAVVEKTGLRVCSSFRTDGTLVAARTGAADSTRGTGARIDVL